MKHLTGALLTVFLAALPLSASAQTATTYQLTDSASAVHQTHGFACLTSQLCLAHVPVDFNGNPFGVSGNPFFISPAPGASFTVTGTFWQATQPVSAASWPLPAGAATSALQSSILGAIGAPLQAGGSIGNTAFGANQGTANTLANAWPSKITDGTNGPAAVKPASTAAVATDPAAVTTTSPNSPEVPFSAYSKASITETTGITFTANTGWNNSTPTFFSFTGACRINGGQVIIPQIDVWSSANPTLKLTGILWVFSGVPGANISNNATFTIASADFANLINFTGIPFTLNNGQLSSGAANSSTSISGTNYAGRCASGTTTMTGMVEVTNAYVSTTGEVLNIGLATVGVN